MLGSSRATICLLACPGPPPPPGYRALAREFPNVTIEAPNRGEADLHILTSAWNDPDFSAWAFDRALDRAAERGRFALTLAGAPAELPRVALELLLRAQRLLARRNQASATPAFTAALARHRAAHDRSRPLVLADYDHALDVWQWVLRLAPEASLALQLAALFHDVERLVSEAERRIEQHAADYQKFKDRDAARGAELAAALLREAGITGSSGPSRGCASSA